MASDKIKSILSTMNSRPIPQSASGVRTATLLLSALLLFFVSCQPSRQENRSNEVVINGLSGAEWTYFSFESGSVVGRSKFQDDEQDATWAARKDWDFAICGDYIKTNGGTSGIGLGGVQINTTSTFDALTEAPADGYIIDTLYINR